MKQLKTIFACGLLVPALTGCWDQDVEDQAPAGSAIGASYTATNVLGANFVKGMVTGATCELYEITGAGGWGDMLASGVTDAGSINFGDYFDYTGVALVQCYGGTYTDEATGEALIPSEMHAVVEVQDDATFSVTPLTEIAYLLSEMDGNMTTALSSYNQLVAGAFGLYSDITSAVPSDIQAGALANDVAGRYAAALALVSQLHANSGGDLIDLLDGLASDLADGEFSAETIDDLILAVADLASSAVADNLGEDALDAIAGVGGFEPPSDNAVASLEDAADEGIWPPGNDILTVTAEIVDETHLVITQNHADVKTGWHENRIYITTDEASSTTDAPLPSGAVLTGLDAHYGFIFTYDTTPSPAVWYISKYEVAEGAWGAAMETSATVSGGDITVATMTIPLSEIGNPASLEDIRIMFVATASGWGYDQVPNDGMYQYVAPGPVEITEEDDVWPPGNDITSVSVFNDETNLLITQTHSDVKTGWHEIRVYANTGGDDTITTPMLSGAPSLTGLVAEHGFMFVYDTTPDPAVWYVSKQEVSGGAWGAGSTTATIAGGDIPTSTIVIPLADLGNPAVGETIQLMFVATALGWGNDQAPNDGMLEYTIQ